MKTVHVDCGCTCSNFTRKKNDKKTLTWLHADDRRPRCDVDARFGTATILVDDRNTKRIRRIRPEPRHRFHHSFRLMIQNLFEERLDADVTEAHQVDVIAHQTRVDVKRRLPPEVDRCWCRRRLKNDRCFCRLWRCMQKSWWFEISVDFEIKLPIFLSLCSLKRR